MLFEARGALPACTPQLRADTVRQFIEDRTEAFPVEHGARADAVYDAYKRWADDSGHRKLARNSFGERMGMAGYASKHFRDGARYPLNLKP